jgi:hypothetical protein
MSARWREGGRGGPGLAQAVRMSVRAVRPMDARKCRGVIVGRKAGIVLVSSA